MKKSIILATVLLSAVAQANPYHHGYRPHHHHHHSGPGWGWVVPAVITGAIVYGATRPAPPPPAPVIYVPPGMNPPPPGFRYEQLLDANCNCYRWVLVQGQ